MSADAGEDEQRGQHGPRRDAMPPPSVLAGYGTYLVAIFVGVPLLVLCLSLTGVLVVHAFAGSRDLPHAIVVAAALALGGFLAVLGLVVRQRRWSARWRRARERLARELKGHLSRDVGPVTAWLEARWKGDYDPRDLWLSAYGFSIVFTTGGGRNALLVLDPIALRRGRGAELPAKLRVRIRRRGRSARAPRQRRTRRHGERRGRDGRGEPAARPVPARAPRADGVARGRHRRADRPRAGMATGQGGGVAQNRTK
jgi:uncharacterized integral membrane protein